MDEDETSEYGEFICSFEKWLPLEFQKENAKRLANITKSKKSK